MHIVAVKVWQFIFALLSFFFFIVLKCQFDPILLWGIKMHVCFVM